MRTNVTRLELKIEFVPARDGDPDRKHLMITIQDDEMENSISPMLHGTWVIDRFIAQCRGEIKWYDKVSFDDVGYQIRVGGDGLQVWQRHGKKSADFYFFTFPMTLLADKLAGAYVSAARPMSRYIFSDEELAEIRKSWWPKARMAFDSQEAYERLLSCLRAEPDGFTAKNVKELTAEIRGLMRVARNYSDGKPTIVHLQVDAYPNSFYWYIMNADGYRVSNGGIIAHAYKDDSGELEYYRYSCHT